MKVAKLTSHLSLIQPQPSHCCCMPSSYKIQTEVRVFSLLHAFVSFDACCLLADVWLCLVQVLLWLDLSFRCRLQPSYLHPLVVDAGF